MEKKDLCEWCLSKGIERAWENKIVEDDHDGWGTSTLYLCQECRDIYHAMTIKAYQDDFRCLVCFFSFFCLLLCGLFILYAIIR